jgi:MFS transporter, DHA1 family, multidrug resistance protein
MTPEDRPAVAPRALSRRSILVGTIVLASMGNAALSAARLVVPVAALAMGASVELIGIAAALFTAFPMLFSVAFGQWVDKSGPFVPFIFSAAMIVLAGAVVIIVPNQYMLLLTTALVGTGAIFTHIVATRAVGEIGEREDRGRNLGLLVMAYSITQFLGPIVAGSAYEHLGVSAAMMFISLAGLSMISGLHFKRHNYRLTGRSGVHGQGKLRISEFAAMPELRKWLIVHSSFIAAIAIFPFMVALHSVEISVSATRAGLVLGAFSAGVFAARAAAPFAGERLRPNLLAHASLLLGGCAYAVLPFTEELVTFAATGAAIGLTLGIGGPVTLALIYDSAPEPRVNEAIGLCLAMSGFLQTAMPLLMGFAGAQIGMAPVILGLAACLTALSVYVVRSRT